jgi:hypothetical protein
MNEFYRVERLNNEGELIGDRGDGRYSDALFEHSDRDQIEHWMFHILAYLPDAEFTITQVVEREIEAE